MARLILASNSPRRRELLQELGYSFSVEPSLFEESAKGLSAQETVSSFARGKAKEVFSRFPDALVLGADTVVELSGEILGKPAGKEEARGMLRALSGRRHNVYTGVCLIGKHFFEEATAVTKVYFRVLPEALIEAYLESGLPFDKAGAYGIQDGYPLVEKIEGSYTNVVGLPTETVAPMYERAMGGSR